VDTVVDPDALPAAHRQALLLGCVVPRPIAWTSTVSRDGTRNLAPFSFFTVVSNTPPMVSLTVERRPDGSDKDTFRNITETGEFVINVVPESLAQPMVTSSGDYPGEIDEFVEAGVTAATSDVVTPPRVAEAPISLECVLESVLRPGSDALLIGRVMRFHLDDQLLGVGGRVHLDALRPLGRLGEMFAVAADLRKYRRPADARIRS
jgi:flavin reductase (DIM6/NTAB) family NADH-FMN oxidoreductase RutF